MTPRRVLVLLVHPALERSRVNRRLFAAAREVSGITTRDLYEEYPSFAIDIEREKALLSDHDVIVFQHPFYWYSIPSLLKEWQDVVLELGWAYGPGGEALRGKLVLHVVTTGGAQAAYRPDGRNRFTLRTLMSPLDQTAHLCGMTFLPPLVVHGSLRLVTDEDVRPYAAQYVRALEQLRDGTLDLERASSCEYLNELFETPEAGLEARP